MRKRIVIIGATSSIAEHCVRLWVQEAPADVVLVGRDDAHLQRIARDLAVRSPESHFDVVHADLRGLEAVQAMADAVFAASAVDIVLVAHGSLPQQVDCQDDLKAAHEALDINGLSPVLVAEAFAQRMSRANRGTIALIGSVAGDRGRKSNYVYGAAKGLVARYAEGLQHRFAGTGIKVVLIKPGPTDTPMTAHLKAAGARLAPVDGVARDIVRGIGRGAATIYTPPIWRIIMLIIRHLPAFVFNKLNI
jgi:short-subunit dehydrogenase